MVIINLRKETQVVAPRTFTSLALQFNCDVWDVESCKRFLRVSLLDDLIILYCISDELDPLENEEILDIFIKTIQGEIANAPWSEQLYAFGLIVNEYKKLVSEGGSATTSILTNILIRGLNPQEGPVKTHLSGIRELSENHSAEMPIEWLSLQVRILRWLSSETSST